MTSFTPNQVINFLVENWRTIDHVKGSHVILYNQENKKRTTVPKHSNKKDLAEWTLLAILRQTGFSKKELAGN